MSPKRVLLLMVMALLTVQFQFACKDKSKDDDQVLSAPINDPENDYQVVVEVISVGGLGGCSNATVSRNEQPVVDAEVTINQVTLLNDTTNTLTAGLYSDTLGLLDYTYPAQYTLQVRHQGKTIAQGAARLPSLPAIQEPQNGQTHAMNKPLTVRWKKVTGATSIQVSVHGDLTDPQTNQEVTTDFGSELLPPTATSFTIPDTVFRLPGTYVLGVTAFNGLNPGMELEQMRDQQGNYQQSYNMTGASGIFLVSNLAPNAEGLKIIVPLPSGKIAKTHRSPALKSLLIRQHQKLLQRVLEQQ